MTGTELARPAPGRMLENGFCSDGGAAVVVIIVEGGGLSVPCMALKLLKMS